MSVDMWVSAGRSSLVTGPPQGPALPVYTSQDLPRTRSTSNRTRSSRHTTQSSSSASTSSVSSRPWLNHQLYHASGDRSYISPGAAAGTGVDSTPSPAVLRPGPHPTRCSWEAERPTTAPGLAPSSPRVINANDMQLVDVHSSDEASTSHLLEAETRYLPLHSELNMSPLRPFNFHQGDDRPQTAPAHAGDARTNLTKHDPVYAESDARPASAGDSPLCKPTQPVNHGHVRRLAANFANMDVAVKPTQSEQQPHSHARRRSSSPVTRPIEITETDSETDNNAPTESTPPSLELKLLKAILADRKSKKSIRKSLQQQLSGSGGVAECGGEQDNASGTSFTPRTTYKTQYSPDKYTSPLPRSEIRNRDTQREGEAQRGAVFHGDRSSNSVASLGTDTLNELQERLGVKEESVSDEEAEKTQAATRLQALWRGYVTRHRNPAVVRIRQEIRARRAEEHIRFLRHELDRQRQLYEQEKHLRTLQLDALKHLWKEVHSLQEWKSQVLVPTTSTSDTATSTEQTARFIQSLQQPSEAVEQSPSATSSFPPCSVGPSTSISMPTQSVTASVVAMPTQSVNASHQLDSTIDSTSQKEVELENACKSLQKQVCQLQEVLSSMSSFVFQGGVINANTAPDSKENTGKTVTESNIRVSTDFDVDSLADTTDTITTSALNNTECSISVGGMSQQTPYPGAPTSPSNLRMQQYGPVSVVLHWMPSLLLDASQPVNQPIIGYRVFVNNLPKGMVSGNQTRALLEGLQLNTLYRVFVKGVSALGESYESNTVEFILKDSDGKSEKEIMDEGGNGGDRKDSDRKKDSDANDSGSESDQDKGDGGSGPVVMDPTSSSTPSNNLTTHPASAPINAPSPVATSDPQTKVKTNPQISTPKVKAPLDLHCEFVKERSRSDDSGYWTSPSPSLLQLQHKDNKPFKVIHSSLALREGTSGQCQDDITTHTSATGAYDTPVPRKTKRVNALLERLEHKIKNPPSKGLGVGDGVRERMTRAGSDDKSILRLSSENKPSNNPRRKMSPDTPMKAFPNTSHDATGTTSSDAEKAFKRAESSKIPILSRKSGRSSPKSSRGSMSDSEFSGKAYQDFRGDSSGEQGDVSDFQSESVGTSSGPLQDDISNIRRHSDSAAEASAGNSPQGSSSFVGDQKSELEPQDLSLNLSGADLDQDVSPLLFHPKPPEGCNSPRKSSLSRRNSLRRRHHSGQSETASKVCESSDLEDTASKMDKSVVFSPVEAVDGGNIPAQTDCESTQPCSGIPIRKDKAGKDSNFRRDDASRGRISVRESKKPKEVKSQRRSSSVGAIMSKLTGGCCSVNTVVATDKPPLAQSSSTRPGIVVEKPPIGRSSREPSTERRREGSSDRRREGSSERRPHHHRRRTKSEQGASSDAEDNNVPGFYQERKRMTSEASSGGKSSDSERESSGEAATAVVRKLAQDASRGRDATPKKKPFSSQKRSGSEFSAIPVLPDRPESPAPRERRSATPNTPTQAPNSPRVRRSSSFSKATPDDNEHPEKVMLRQCISLETLKAVKSQEMKQSQEGLPGATASAGSSPPSSNPTKPTIYSHRRVASSGQLQDFLNKKAPEASASHDTTTSHEVSDDAKTSPIRRRVSMKDEKLRAAIERMRENKSSSEQAAAEAPPQVAPQPYSPKLGSKLPTDAKPRKIKIPNRAADLFAKLQVRLSANKMS